MGFLKTSSLFFISSQSRLAAPVTCLLFSQNPNQTQKDLPTICCPSWIHTHQIFQALFPLLLWQWSMMLWFCFVSINRLIPCRLLLSRRVSSHRRLAWAQCHKSAENFCLPWHEPPAVDLIVAPASGHLSFLPLKNWQVPEWVHGWIVMLFCVSSHVIIYITTG